MPRPPTQSRHRSTQLILYCLLTLNFENLHYLRFVMISVSLQIAKSWHFCLLNYLSPFHKGNRSITFFAYQRHKKYGYNGWSDSHHRKNQKYGYNGWSKGQYQRNLNLKYECNGWAMVIIQLSCKNNGPATENI